MLEKVRRTALHKRQSGIVPGGPPRDDGPNTSTTTSTGRTAATTTTTSSISTTSTTSATSLTGTTTSAIATTALTAETSSTTLTSASTTTTANTAATSPTSITTTPRTTPTVTPTRTTTTNGISTRPAGSRPPTGSPTTLPSITPSATESSIDGAPVGTIIGVIAGGLIGVIALAAGAGWLFRRYFRKKKDFNRGNFIRQSMAIPDNVDYTHEKVPMGSKNALNLARANTLHDREINPRGPRPPTVIERHVNLSGPGAVPSFQPGQVMTQDPYYQNPQAAGYQYGAYAQPGYPAAGYNYGQGQDQYYNYNNYAASAYTPPTEHQQSELTRRPSGPGSAHLQRQRSNGANLQASTAAEFSSGRPESVTPFQQQQYAEISRQLNDPGFIKPTATENGAAAATSTTPAEPEKAAPVGRSLSTSYSSLNPNKPSHANPEATRSGTPTDPNPQQNYYQPNAANKDLKVPQQGQGAKRESVFNADDAYGGM